MRRWLVVLVVAACHNYGPTMNEVVHKDRRHVVFRGKLTAATFCRTCGRDAPVTVRWGDAVQLSTSRTAIRTPRARSAITIDAVHVELLDSHAVADSGELDITECTSSQVIAKLWASFPDGTRIDAIIDTPLVDPGH